MVDEQIKKLMELKNRITYTRDNKEKFFLLNDYYSLRSFLEAINKMPNDSKYDLLEEHQQMYLKITNNEYFKVIMEIVKNSAKLEIIVKDLINTYHQYNFYGTNSYPYNGVNSKIMQFYLKSFFWNLGDDILNLFYRMVKEERIVYGEFDGDSAATSTIYTDLGYILINQCDDQYGMYVDVVHEMGHIYQFALQKNNTKLLYDVNLYSELISLTFEKLFILFMKDNKVYSHYHQNIDNYYHSLRLYRLSVCKLINELMNDSTTKLHIEGNDYGIKIPFTNEEVKRKLQNDCGTGFEGSKRIGLLEFIYVINEILSSYFYYAIIDNYAQGMRELKEFVMNVNEYSLSDAIDKYFYDGKFCKRYIHEYMKKKE